MENKEKDMKQLLSDEELKNVNGGVDEWGDPSTWTFADTSKQNAYCNQYSYPKLDKEGCNNSNLCQWFPSSYGSDFGYCLQVKLYS